MAESAAATPGMPLDGPGASTPKKRGRRPDKVMGALRASLLKLLASKNFDDLTARDIILDSRVSPATFYRHYRSKTALLEAVADQEMETLVLISNSFQASTWETSLAQIRHIDENRTLWSVLINGGAASYVRKGFIQRLSLEYCDERWRLGTWLPNDLAIRFSVSSMVEIISWWLRQDTPLPLETIAEMFEGLTVRPTLIENAPKKRAKPRNKTTSVPAASLGS